jgi:regulatory protein
MLRKITALRLQKKNRHRVNVYLDGEYAFAVQMALATSLGVGQTLSSEDVAQLQTRDAAEIAYEKALGFLSYRPRSRAEIEAYLGRRKVAPEAIEATVNRLLQAGLLDDGAFAKYWVENRELFRPRGARALRYELRQKGVADRVIEQVLEGIDETDSAYRAARERARRFNKVDYQTFRQRLGGFLQRRGFGYDIVKQTVDRLWRERQGPTMEGMS